MSRNILFPFSLAVCLVLGLSVSAAAQTGEARERQVLPSSENPPTQFADDPVIISLASPEDIKAATVLPVSAASIRLEQLISSAIDQRLGARYKWGGTGPSRFDCSGFVWSTFQSAGINFERGSARTLWGRFEPAGPEERFKFGTLVFFSGLTHIGIVADEHGFYHASRRHGVIYSPFSDYWLSRIDGFRRVPLIELTEFTTTAGQ
ncbi:MAG: C40 family peptidase [Pyrinomonadaceae bacterium]